MTDFSIVIEFTVLGPKGSINNLLQKLTDNITNICAFSIREDKVNKLEFKFVIDPRESETEVSIIKNILKKSGLQFYEEKVIKVSSANNLRDINMQHKALIEKLDLYASYVTFDRSIIYKTCCPTKAIQILNSL